MTEKDLMQGFLGAMQTAPSFYDQALIACAFAVHTPANSEIGAAAESACKNLCMSETGQDQGALVIGLRTYSKRMLCHSTPDNSILEMLLQDFSKSKDAFKSFATLELDSEEYGIHAPFSAQDKELARTTKAAKFTL